MDTTYMRTWAEIDLDALTHNYNALRAMTPEGCRLLGLCKANAYGHGATEVGKKLAELGAEILAVACLEEAIELRRVGITIPILCLGQMAAHYAPALLEYDVTATVCDIETAQALSRAAVAANRTIAIHVKVDTGMTRLGFLWQEGRHAQVIDEIAQLCALPNIRAEGLFTHFADADGSEAYTMQQFASFLDIQEQLTGKNVKFEIYHCANSAAMLHYPCTHLDMVRPGLVLYGYYPDEASVGLDGCGLRPVMKLKSRIVAVRDIAAGTCVSYGCMATVERDSRLAVLPIGYGDGYFRHLSDGMSVLIAGERCPVVGRVCMDMCMVDVTDLPAVQAGDVAVVYGEGGLLEEAAHRADTITYELLCDVNPRVPRVYHDTKQ